MVINMKITVLAGGTSTERDVSLVTGSMIYKSLVKSGHQVVLVDLYLGYDGADYTDVFAIKKTGVKAFRQSPARILISGR